MLRWERFCVMGLARIVLPDQIICSRRSPCSRGSGTRPLSRLRHGLLIPLIIAFTAGCSQPPAEPVAKVDPGPVESQRERLSSESPASPVEAPSQPATVAEPTPPVTTVSPADSAAPPAAAEDHKSPVAAPPVPAATEPPKEGQPAPEPAKPEPADADPTAAKPEQPDSEEQKPAGAKQAAPAGPKWLPEVQDAIVTVSMLDADGETLVAGTGFFVDAQGLVATNYHVVREGAKASVKFRNGQSVDVTGVAAADPERDLVLLSLDRKPPKPVFLKPAAQQPALEKEVVALSAPPELDLAWHQGLVKAVVPTKDLPGTLATQVPGPEDEVWILSTAAVEGTAGGGPLLNAEGELVGVNTWTFNNKSGSLSIDVKHLTALVPQAKAEPQSFEQVRRDFQYRAALAKLGGEAPDFDKTLQTLVESKWDLADEENFEQALRLASALWLKARQDQLQEPLDKLRSALKDREWTYDEQVREVNRLAIRSLGQGQDAVTIFGKVSYIDEDDSSIGAVDIVGRGYTVSFEDLGNPDGEKPAFAAGDNVLLFGLRNGLLPDPEGSPVPIPHVEAAAVLPAKVGPVPAETALLQCGDLLRSGRRDERFNKALRSAHGVLKPIEYVLHSTKTPDQPPKWNKLRLNTYGAGFDAVRFKAPDDQRDMHWFVRYATGAIQSWYILPAKHQEGHCGFRNYTPIVAENLETLGKYLEGAETGFLQGLPAKDMIPGEEYILWFTFPSRQAAEIEIAMEFFAPKTMESSNAEFILDELLNKNGGHGVVFDEAYFARMQELTKRFIKQQAGVAFRDEFSQFDLPGSKTLASDKEIPPNPHLLELHASAASSTFLNDDDLKLVHDMPYLRRVWLADQYKLTDAAMANWKNLPGLYDLSLSRTPLGDASIPQLKKLTALRILNVNHTKFTATGLAELAALPQLRVLSADGVPLTPQVFEQASGIEELTIGGPTLTDNVLKSVAKLPNLRRLTLAPSGITRDGLSALQDCDRLATLEIFSIPLDQESLDRLTAIEPLKHLALRGTGLAPEVRDAWQAKRPDLAGEVTPYQQEPPPIQYNDEYFARRRKVVEFVNSLGGYVTVLKGKIHKDIGPGDPVPEDIGEFSIVDIRMDISLGAALISDEHLAQFADIDELRGLSLTGQTEITDAGLTKLRNLRQMYHFSLNGTQASDGFVANLVDSARVVNLKVAHTKITPQGLAALAQLKTLATLDIEGLPVTKELLEQFAQLPALYQLKIGHASCDDDCLLAILKGPRMSQLSITGASLTARGLSQVDQSRLRDLQLIEMPIAAEVMKAADALRKIDSLQLVRTGNSSDEIELLRKGAAGQIRSDQARASANGGLRAKPIPAALYIPRPARALPLPELPADLDADYFARNRACAEAVQRAGGGLTFFDTKGRQVAWNRGEPIPAGDIHVTAIDLNGYSGAQKITEKDLQCIAGLAGLERLLLDGQTQITDQGIRHLKDLPRLIHLDLGRTSVGDAGLLHITQFATLQHVNLNETLVSEAGLNALSRIPNLESLWIAELPVSVDTIEMLAYKLPRLQRIRLTGKTIDDQVLAALPRIRHLVQIQLDVGPHTAAGLASLRGCRKLKELTLDHTPLDQKRLLVLAELPITVFSSKTEDGSREQIDWLGKVLPGARISYGPSRPNPPLHSAAALQEAYAAADSQLAANLAPWADPLFQPTPLVESNGTDPNPLVLKAGRPPLAPHERFTPEYFARCRQAAQFILSTGRQVVVEIAGSSSTERMTATANTPLPSVDFHLKEIELSARPPYQAVLKDSDLAVFSDLLMVSSISLAGQSQITDKGLALLTGLQSLKELNLEGTNAGDQGVAVVLQSSVLVGVNLNGTQVTPEFLAKHLNPEKRRNLQRLYIFDVPVTSDLLARLQELPRFNQLEIGGDSVNDATLEEVVKIRQLEFLRIWSTQISPAGLDHLKAARKLQHLLIGDTALEQEHLVKLNKLPLKMLELVRTGVEHKQKQQIELLIPAPLVRIYQHPHEYHSLPRRRSPASGEAATNTPAESTAPVPNAPAAKDP